MVGRIKLDIEFEFDDVAVLHDIGFALSAELAGGFYRLLGAVFCEIVKIANIGGDETALEVGVDGAGGLGGGGALLDGPSAAFLLAGGKEGLETQCVVGGFDELLESVVFDAVALQEFLALFAGHARHFFL